MIASKHEIETIIITCCTLSVDIKYAHFFPIFVLMHVTLVCSKARENEKVSAFYP